MSDVYVVTHVVTTCDDSPSSSYVSRDSTELIELAWCLVDARTLACTHQGSVLVKPVNTPITLYCSQLHRISWEHVRDAGSFKNAINEFEEFMQTHVISQNKEFSLVTIDATTLRVQLPREARDKSIVLPPYLQHPRVFDLTNEYAKWQTSHPEALSYTPNSLSNIITALQVELDPSDDLNFDILPSIASSLSSSPVPPVTSDKLADDKSPADDGPSAITTNSLANVTKQANSETKSKALVNLCSKLLTQLIKKSLPLSDHLSVLTKPYDSAQDARIFLAERSKILYLSNLPPDTTQSELESWFTQFGGRPIAFWSLKNLEANNNNTSNNNGNSPTKLPGNTPNGAASTAEAKGTSGFAVFSKHEEAAESLSMNGRVLNDRAIEVQPSSTRVLDRASDLLTPFPPSKNRPRPGDWTCPSCGFSNFQRRTACFRCAFPATSAVTIQETMYSNNGSHLKQGGNSNNNGMTNNNRHHQKNPSVNHRHNNTSANNINGKAVDKLAFNAAVANAAAVVLNNNSGNTTNTNLTGGVLQYNNNPNGSNNHTHSHSYSQGNHLNNPAQHNGNNSNSGYHGHTHSLSLNHSNSQGHTNGFGISSNGHNNNNGGSRYGNNVPFRAGDWKCLNDNCQYHNFAKNLCCLKCGGAKPINTNTNNGNSGSLGINNNNNLNSNSNNNGQNNNHENHHHNNNNGGHLHSVNSTAAAIAAATASGQPLNLTNNFIGLHQPQPHSAKNNYNNRYPQPSSLSPTSGQYANNVGNNSYNNLTNNNSHRQSGRFGNHPQGGMYGQQSGQSSQSTPQPSNQISLLPQQLALLQQQQQQQPHQSGANSPGLFGKFGIQQQQQQQQPISDAYFDSHRGSFSGSSNGSNGYVVPPPAPPHGINTNVANSTGGFPNFMSPPHSAPVDGSASYNSLSNQIGSLSINHH